MTKNRILPLNILLLNFGIPFRPLLARTQNIYCTIYTHSSMHTFTVIEGLGTRLQYSHSFHASLVPRPSPQLSSLAVCYSYCKRRRPGNEAIPCHSIPIPAKFTLGYDVTVLARTSHAHAENTIERASQLYSSSNLPFARCRPNNLIRTDFSCYCWPFPYLNTHQLSTTEG